METHNPKLNAIVSIRNLVHGISTDWKELKSLGAEIDELVQSASTQFINDTAVIAHERWLTELGKVNQNIGFLKDIMNRVVDKINAKDSKELAEIWDNHKAYSSDLHECLNTLSDLGKVHLSKQFHTKWIEKWKVIFSKFEDIQQLAAGSSLHLSMISEYTPDEVDELTDTILRNMPKQYTLEEAAQYEKEYMAAYENLKKEAGQKKNLWDRFLDLLAGGIQQSPAEIVMMQRWIEGEKGEL